MDFLKSAIASAIAKGPAFGYAFGDRVDIDQSIWTLHNGTKREDGSKCSIFSFDVSANKSKLPLAKNALRKFRTIRHPGVVRVLDTVETDTYIYVATERIEPLGWKTRRKALAEGSITWGLHNLAKTLRFINDEAASVHGNVRVSSVFTTESGEWKLAGLEALSSMKEDDAIIYTYGSVVPDSGRYAPPEVAKGGWDSIKRGPISAVDSYDYGILISEVFTGGFSGSDQVGKTKDIPHAMHNHYKRLVNPNPKLRLSIAHFLEQGARPGSFFDTPLIQLSDGIENLGLKTEGEREEFLTELDTVAQSDDFPEEFFKVKVLPELLKSAEFGGGGPRVISLIMRISQKLSEDEYTAQITPVVVRLFQSPDRALRVALLDSLPLMVDHLSQKLVSDKIFPQMVTGFTDLAPVVREQTVKAVLVVISKLSDRVINGELLRHLAKTANDEQPGIRTNTTICLGKIAKNLGPNSRTKVLVAAFTRSLRDPFVHARNAALLALGATADLFSEDDCATKILPAICPSLVDKEKLVRDQGNKTLDLYLQRVRKYGQSLPDSILPPPETGVPAAATAPRMGTPSGENTWAGWAISSFTNKFAGASGQMQPNANGVASPPISRPTSVPPNSDAVKPSRLSAGQTRLVPTHSSPAIPQISTSASASPQPEEEDFGDDWGAMDEEEVADAWGAPPATKTLPATKTTPVASAAYDDQGEPDFEGWLNAQAQAKKQPSKPLPKGLTKKATATVTGTKSATQRAISASKPQSAVKKPEAKLSPAPTPAQDDGDDWGDAWG
ncbi:protein kinase [Myriangium duriaei CBS 260.36]|uniref:Protein kinase n=1 Tax=Myriangium duriaei CBS 260.36 TaxID=1168546 RepID=A0A9P4J049_9PEZI|nr:protein kinase [Myriangium duriaei CBS 260.36]